MNEIDLYGGGGLQPYNPLQPLAPSPDTWGNTDVDQLTPREVHSGGGQIIFGQTLPAGVSVADVQAAFSQMAGVFQSDFQKLGHKPSHIQAAVSWLMDALDHPPQPQRQHHRYNLFEHSQDPIFQAFANYANDHGFSAKLVQDTCWWVTEATKRLNAQGRTPRTAPSTGVSDAEWARLEAKSVVDKQRGQDELRNRWGHEYTTRMRVVTSYYGHLPQRDKDFFENAFIGDMAALNHPDTITKLYFQAVGGHSLPKGSGLQTEIQQIESLIRSNRRAYNEDEALQMRYRLLLEQRDGS